MNIPRLRCVLYCLALGALAPTGFAQQTSAPPQRPQQPTSAPFYIAPVIEGFDDCLGAKRYPGYEKYSHSDSLCVTHDFDAVKALKLLLDPIEPGGPAGAVQLGYTMTVPLLTMFKQGPDGKGWVIDEARIDDYLGVIAQVERPVVVYLVANHFDTKGPLSRELGADKTNLMLLPSGEPPSADYYGNQVIPFTLSADEAVPVNRYRFEAARVLAKRIAALPPTVQSRIIAVTMAGEVHEMFRNFETGMGAFEDAQVTDYNPRSVARFRKWLETKYGSLEAFNKSSGFDYKDFDTVPAPGKNIRSDKLTSFGEHYDGFAHGELPVAGWLWDPKRQVAKLELFVDGKSAGELPRGLNRLDVYRAVEDITDPNVGFRLDLPFDKMPVGRHVGQVVAHADGKRYLLGQFDFNVVGRDQGKLSDALPPRLGSGLEPIAELKGTRAWLDLPKSPQDVYFNPLARDWNQFRNEQVLGFLAKFHEIAQSAGIAPDKLYSHQIVPQANSSWNDKLFAVDQSLRQGLPWKSGLNMYGGAANSDWVRAFVTARKLADYGVPEFNPQQWKLPTVHRDAMLAQKAAGARFISPYYLSITSARVQDKDKKVLNRLELRPDNDAEGSAAFYRALGELARQ